VSAADGTNVVKVFHSAVLAGKRFKEGGGDTMAEIMKLLGGDNPNAFSGIRAEEKQAGDRDSKQEGFAKESVATASDEK
jgi:hypothetical protein